MAFMTLDPEEHHQVFLVDGKPDEPLPANRFMPGIGPVLHHLSFRLASMSELRRMYQRLGAESDRAIRTVTHGVCWAMYTTDPEGNALEFFADTPWYITQPVMEPIDFSQSDEDLYNETEVLCRASPGFRPYADFNAELARRVPASLTD
jgi:catechol-2,3-dioxygenase